MWARTIRGDAGVNLLVRFNLLEQALDLALEMDLYAKAEEVAKQHFRKRLPDVYFKHAVALEEDGRFQEAEEEFIKAGKPKEAIGIQLQKAEMGRVGGYERATVERFTRITSLSLLRFDYYYTCTCTREIGSVLQGMPSLARSASYMDS